ncbi:HtaA domain-containing protein [Leucobacter sp. M11]|uniref:HtaA domain-containing protein n=1 Tax=Leucobacter sp. M11 TaxID=2993565 RepID=UPI002D7FD8A3|nr:HtaA domain-containing protein [Leucobacter sp. M11]MEB4615467.1 HtaA domain-containing protein [Leucobacter sp. M11]
MEKGTILDQTMPNFGLKYEWVRATGADGTFTSVLSVPADKLDRSKEYEVAVWRGHTMPAMPTSNLTVVPVEFSTANWDMLFPAPASEAKVSFAVEAAATGLTVPVSGTGFLKQAAGDGVYVAVITAGQAMTVTGASSDAVIGVKYLSPKAPAGKGLSPDGTFTTSIALPKDKLASGEAYEVLVWNAHGIVTEESLVSVEALPVTAEQWETVFPKPAERSIAAKTGTITANTSLAIDVVGQGYPASGFPNGVYVSLIEAGTASELNPTNLGIESQWVRVSELKDSAFSWTLTVDASKVNRLKEYEVAVWRGHTMPSAENADLETAALTISEADWDKLFDQDSASLAASVAQVKSKTSITFSATGKNYRATDYPNGVTVALFERGKSTSAASLVSVSVSAKQLEKGTFTTDLVARANALDRAKSYEVSVWRNPAKPSAGNAALVTVPVSISGKHWDALFPAPKTEQGSLSWGVREAFVTYVEGPIAQGAIQVDGKLATRQKNSFTFKQVSGGTWDAKKQTGSVKYGGWVKFTGHHGALDLNLTQVEVRVESAKKAGIYAYDELEKRMARIGDVDLSQAKRTEQGNAVTWTGAPATVTAQGRMFFQDYLPSNDNTLAPLTFTVGTASTEKPVTPPKPPVVKPNPGTGNTGGSTPGTKPLPVTRPAAGQVPGSLNWGVHQAFEAYVTGPIAKGAITPSGVGPGYQFPQAAGGSWDAKTQTGTVQFSGSVNYSGHKGALNQTIANPAIRVTSATSAELIVGGSVFGTLNLAAGSKSTGAGGSVTWSGVPVSLTGQGSAFFQGRYSSADALSFTVGSVGTAGGAAAKKSAEKKTVRTPAATAPATSGLMVITDPKDIVAGGEIRVSAPGFEAQEEGILAVLYSEPMVLDREVQANSDGVVTWVGTLPEDITGKHTLTLQGSTNVGAVLTIGEAKDELPAGQCKVSQATLDWGVKESFRSYLRSTGGGDWSMTGKVTERDGIFHWATGEGGLSKKGDAGTIRFAGGVNFSGHAGALDTTLSNPKLDFSSATKATLRLDVDSQTMEGEQITDRGVPFATVNLDGATKRGTDGTLTITDATVTLLESGEAAFGNYSAGEALDTLSATITPEDDCGAAAQQDAKPERAEAPKAAVAQRVAEPIAEGGLPAWAWWAGAGVLLLVALGLVLALVAQRRAAREG